MYLSISTGDTRTKFEISGVMWHVTPESEIQLVSCELSPKSRLGIFHIWRHTVHRRVYFLSLIFSVLLSDCLFIFVTFTHKFSGCTCSSELYLLNFPVSEKLRFSDTPIHIWSTYLVLYCCVRMFIFGVAGIEIWTKFIIALYFYLLPDFFFSLAWFYTIITLLVRNICSLCSSFQIFHIQVIIFKGR